jgi:methyl-CpG-binding domain protein 4
VPPRSPFSLIQEDLFPNRWAFLCACVMLNCTSRKQVETVLPEFLNRWPSPTMLFDSYLEDVKGMISSLGFGNRRAAALITLAKELTLALFHEECLTVNTVRALPGIGAYGLASYLIFFEKTIPAAVKDHALVQYVSWLEKMDYTHDYRREKVA